MSKAPFNPPKTAQDSRAQQARMRILVMPLVSTNAATVPVATFNKLLADLKIALTGVK